MAGDTISVTGTTNGAPGQSTTLLVKKAIKPIQLRWMAQAGGAPGIEKQWREGQIHFNQQMLSDTTTIDVTGERERTAQSVTIGTVTVPQGLATVELSTIRFGIPINAQRQALLEVELDLGVRAQQYFQLLGVSLTAEATGERTPKGGGT